MAKRVAGEFIPRRAEATTAPDIVAKVTGAEHDLLVSEIPETPAAWEELKKKINANPVYVKNLVSADGQATALSITFLESIDEDEFVRRGVDDKIELLVRLYASLTGSIDISPPFQTNANRQTTRRSTST